MKRSSKIKFLILFCSAAIFIASCSSTKNKVVATGSSTTTSITTTTQSSVICPLTGLPLQPGQSINRPALAVKIDNITAARPQTGLNQADIVFEEPVEGFITRFVAVFNCNEPSEIGPIRSARYEDIGILKQLSAPIFVHAGGITPVVNLILADAPGYNINILANPSIIIHPPGKIAPQSTYMAPSSAWNMDSSDTTPPTPIFVYSTAIPTALNPQPVNGIHIDFSYSSNETWQWNTSDNSWHLYYSGIPATDPAGKPITAQNIVVQNVTVSFGPWIEDAGGGLEVVPNFLSGGPATILRNGQAISGLWARSSLSEVTKFYGSNGQVIPLQPGRTFVEIVPHQAKQNLITSTTGNSGTTTSGG